MKTLLSSECSMPGPAPCKKRRSEPSVHPGNHLALGCGFHKAGRRTLVQVQSRHLLRVPDFLCQPRQASCHTHHDCGILHLKVKARISSGKWAESSHWKCTWPVVANFICERLAFLSISLQPWLSHTLLQSEICSATGTSGRASRG